MKHDRDHIWGPLLFLGGVLLFPEFVLVALAVVACLLAFLAGGTVIGCITVVIFLVVGVLAIFGEDIQDALAFRRWRSDTLQKDPLYFEKQSWLSEKSSWEQQIRDASFCASYPGNIALEKFAAWLPQKIQTTPDFTTKYPSVTQQLDVWLAEHPPVFRVCRECSQVVPKRAIQCPRCRRTLQGADEPLTDHEREELFSKSCDILKGCEEASSATIASSLGLSPHIARSLVDLLAGRGVIAANPVPAHESVHPQDLYRDVLRNRPRPGPNLSIV